MNIEVGLTEPVSDPGPNPDTEVISLEVSHSQEDIEQNRDYNPVPSRNLSPLSSQLRLEFLGDHIHSFDSDWKFCGALQIVPEQSIVLNMVYSIPPNLPKSVSVDQRVLDKASKLSLHPKKEHMRMNIAKALVSHKPRSPKTKAKSGLLSRVLKRL